MINMVKLPTKNKRMFLRVARGHFATSHSHINYYIDVTMQKSRLSEAAEAAKELDLPVLGKMPIDAGLSEAVEQEKFYQVSNEYLAAAVNKL